MSAHKKHIGIRLNRRYGWGPVMPLWACVLGLAMVGCGFVVTCVTLRMNKFASGTIGLEKDQRGISSGPYRFVRHPMYSGIVLLVVGMPFGLGSVVALATGDLDRDARTAVAG